MSNDEKRSMADTRKWIRTATTISEALPYLKNFSGATFVIKYGGHAMGDSELSQNFARDVVLLKHVGINPVIVHGGGPQINEMLGKLGKKSSFIHGHRVTDAETAKIAEMVLSGTINKEVAGSICSAGGNAIGLSGKDGNLIQCTKLIRKVRDPNSNSVNEVDLGFVGKPEKVNVSVLNNLAASDIIPVIAPIGLGVNNETYNINADTCAGSIAAALGAAKLIMMTDVAGVLDSKSKLINQMDAFTARGLIDSGVISNGMIPKVETCLNAIEKKVAAAHILDGRVPHVLLLEIFTEHGTGTMMVKDKQNT